MRTSVALLAATVALCLVLPHCRARPSNCLVKKSAQKACARSSAVQESQVVQKVGCGCAKKTACGCGKSPKRGSIVRGAIGAVVGTATVAVGTASVAPLVATKVAGKTVSTVLSPGSPSCQVKSADSCTELTAEQIKSKYARQSGESLLDYYKRILARSYSWTSTPASYLKTLNLVRKDFCNLDLWYDRKYINLVKDYYLTYYARKENEPWESYYSRLVFREDWEKDDELYARRITIVRDCFPNLDELWLNEKYTKSLYAIEFKKFAKESDEEYMKRIFERDSYFDTCDEVWAKRLFLIQEATISSCPLWYNDKYLPYFKNYYSIYYKNIVKDTDEDWLVRVLSPLPNESLDNAIKRINFIKECTGSWGYWKPDYFKKIQQSQRLDKNWLLKVQKSFFPSCGCGGAVAVGKSSSRVSAVASASASASS